MLLSTHELQQLIATGVIDAPMDAVKGTSIDVRLHNILLLEKEHTSGPLLIIPRVSKMAFTIKDLTTASHWMTPHQFLLGSLIERINLPNNLTGKFYLDSSLARCGQEHSAAISIKPGWQGKLTLELINVSQFHKIRLHAGMPIGCIEFTRHDPATAYTGQYQLQEEVGG